MDQLNVLLSIAADLTSASTSEERRRRLLQAIRQVVPFDAAAMLRADGDTLVPVAAHGLTADALGRRFVRREHPRLEAICSAVEPVVFAADSPLPDPFDGLIARDPHAVLHVHACLGCALRVEDKLVGALTADAFAPGAFDQVDRQFLAAVGALAAAEMRTTSLIEALERRGSHQGDIAADLMRDLEQRQGDQFVGVSPAIQRVRKEIELVGHSDLTVLIVGETGTGKELVARALHRASPRSREAMLYVNCAALPEALAESELFGHLKGAFTGASSDRPGKFEIADHGTLFLDEIGELPLPLQAKLLRALQQGEIQRVGQATPLRVDVRVIAATNRRLADEIAANRFRADLFHRLNVFPIVVPPLRERREDIPLLAGHFCDLARRRLGLGPVRLPAATLAALTAYAWPGNARELDNVLARATLKASAEVRPGEPVVLMPLHLGAEFATSTPVVTTSTATIDPAPGPRAPLAEALRDFQRRYIEQAVATSDGNWAAAARALGLHRSNLHRLAKKLGIR